MIATTLRGRTWPAVVLSALAAVVILTATLIVFRLCVERLEIDFSFLDDPTRQPSTYGPTRPPSLGNWYLGLHALVIGGILAAAVSTVVLARLITRGWTTAARVVVVLLVPLCLGGAILYISAADGFYCDLGRSHSQHKFALFGSSGWDEIGILPGVPIVGVNGCQES